MDCELYKTYMASAAACFKPTLSGTTCAICLDDLERPTAPGDRRTLLAATCRLACGHQYHHECILQCRNSGQDSCALCRLQMFPTYPSCGYCRGDITPSVPVTTFSCCGKKMHALCADDWLTGMGSRWLGGCRVCRAARRSIMAEEIAEALRDRQLQQLAWERRMALQIERMVDAGNASDVSTDLAEEAGGEDIVRRRRRRHVHRRPAAAAAVHRERSRSPPGAR